MAEITKAVVLAAGNGTRLLPVTEEISKAMVEVNKKPLLEYSLSALAEAGIKDAAIVVGYKAEEIRKRFGSEFRGMKLAYLMQYQQMGTAHAASLAKKFCADDSFIMVYADLLFEKRLIKGVLAVGGFDCVMVGIEVNEPSRYGILETEGNIVKNLVEKPPAGTEPGRLANYGIYLFSPRLFGVIDQTKISPRGEFELTDSIKLLIPDGKVSWIPGKGILMDVTNPEDIARAENAVKENEGAFC